MTVYDYGPDTTPPPMLVIRIAMIRMAAMADDGEGNRAAIWNIMLPGRRGACQQINIYVS